MSLPRFSVRNPVLVNLIMGVIVVGGIAAAYGMVREMFPTMTPDKVLISAIYPGASPEEIERSVVRIIEERIKDVDDVDEIEAVVNEGACLITAEVPAGGRDVAAVADDIDQEIKRIDTFPDGLLEEPKVEESRYVLPAIMVALYGEVSERQLRSAGKRLEKNLSLLPHVSETALSGVRDEEIRVETDPDKLAAYDLSFAEVAAAVRRGNLDLPAGRMRAAGGDLLLRTKGETLRVEDIAKIPVRADTSGRYIRVGDVARVVDDYDENRIISRFNGKHSVDVTVLASPGEDVIALSEIVKKYVNEHRETWRKQGLSVGLHSDLSKYVKGRLDLLTRNGLWGLLLVLVVLALLLDLRVAFWVALGMPISFLGALAAMHLFGLTLNMLTMFGLIIVLGMLVDDAIVIGENIHHYIQAGLSPAAAAVKGAEEVSWPVIAAVSTTIAAFVPMLFIEGRMGKFLGVLPLVVIAALSTSLLEALVILPSHMADWIKAEPKDAAAGGRRRRRGLWQGFMEITNRWRDDLFDRRFAGLHERFVRFCLRHRYETIGAAICLFFVVVGLVKGKRVPFEFFHVDDSEVLLCTLEMPEGTPVEETEKAAAAVEAAVKALPSSELKSVSTIVGNSYNFRSGRTQTGEFSYLAQVVVELKSLDEGRKRVSDEITNQLREQTARIPGVKKILFRAAHGPGAGKAFEVELQGENLDEVREVARALKREMTKYPVVHDIDDTDRAGKVEIGLHLKDTAAAQGLTLAAVADQVRGAYYGLKAQTLQRGPDEVEVWVRLPLADRRRVTDLDQLRITLPGGGRTTLGQVAALEPKRGFSTIRRVNGRRVITVSADIEQSGGKEGSTQEITHRLTAKLGKLCAAHPGVSFRLRGQAEEQKDTLHSLFLGFLFALFMIYAILAAILRSYTQPLIILVAIPFGFVGAVLGHYLLGFSLTILSLIGMLALAGIAVNDSIVLVDYINRAVGRGVPVREAVVQGSRRRLKAILLTSITTIFGLLPMMTETSFQARFLIPMAVSISGGLAYTTFVTLVFLPCFYMIREDIYTFLHFLWTWRWEVRGTATVSHGDSEI